MDLTTSSIIDRTQWGQVVLVAAINFHLVLQETGNPFPVLPKCDS